MWTKSPTSSPVTTSDSSPFANYLGNVTTITGANGYSVTGRAILDYGGLGDLLLDDPTFKAQVLTTSALCVLLAVVLDLVLVGVQRMLTPWTRKAAT